MNKTQIIAEVGPNHNGSFEIALDFVERLSKFEIDVIKFQIADPEKVYSKDSFKADYQKLNDKSKTVIEMSKKNQLSRDEHLKLYNECKKRNIKYAVTAFDIENLKYLEERLDLPFLKIPSGEIRSIDLLEFIKLSEKEILLSTGMSEIEEIQETLKFLDPESSKKITILHCVSSYPARNEDLNLNFFDTLKLHFPNYKLGYSDHSKGEEACLIALAKGACVLEKHVTIDNHLDGPDHKSSMLIDDFGVLVGKIRKSEILLGNNEKFISSDQSKIRDMAMKSIVSLKDINKGESISLSNICFKRPGTGISPLDLESIIGCKVNKDIEINKIINKEDIIRKSKG